MDSGTPYKSELELLADGLEGTIVVVNAFRRKFRFWYDKRAKAAEFNAIKAGQSPSESLQDANIDELEPVDDFSSEIESGHIPVADFIQDKLQQLESLELEQIEKTFGVVFSDELDKVEVVPSLGETDATARIIAFNSLSGEDIDSVLIGSDDFSLAAHYLQASAKDVTLVDSASGNLTRIQFENNQVLISRLIERNDLLEQLELSQIHAAAKWCGGTPVMDQPAAWFPVTNDLKIKASDVAAGLIATSMSDDLAFASKSFNSVRAREAARLENLLGKDSTSIVPESFFDKAWDASSLDGFEYHEVKISEDRIAAVWTKDGKAERHPEGVPSLILDKDRRVVAAGHFDNGEASGDWFFTDETRSFVQQKARVDKYTGFATNVYSRASESNEFVSRPDLDGARLFHAQATAAFGVATVSGISAAISNLGPKGEDRTLSLISSGQAPDPNSGVKSSAPKLT